VAADAVIPEFQQLPPKVKMGDGWAAPEVAAVVLFHCQDVPFV
jgi:hypothetical protein